VAARVIRSRVLAHADETERPFGCGSDDRSADCDLPPDQAGYVPDRTIQFRQQQ
jgi:hypothetical protein